MGCPKENQSRGGGADGVVFGVFLGVEECLVEQQQLETAREQIGERSTYLFDDETTQAMPNENDLGRHGMLVPLFDIHLTTRMPSYHLRSSLHIQQIQQSICMILDTRRGHGLWIRDI